MGIRWRNGKAGKRRETAARSDEPKLLCSRWCRIVGGELREGACTTSLDRRWIELKKPEDRNWEWNDSGVFELREMSQICGQNREWKESEREGGDVWAVAIDSGSPLSRACVSLSLQTPS